MFMFCYNFLVKRKIFEMRLPIKVKFWMVISSTLSFIMLV